MHDKRKSIAISLKVKVQRASRAGRRRSASSLTPGIVQAQGHQHQGKCHENEEEYASQIQACTREAGDSNCRSQQRYQEKERYPSEDRRHVEPSTAIQRFSPPPTNSAARKFQTVLISERGNPSLDSLDMNCKRSLDITRYGSAIGLAELRHRLVDVDPWRRRQAELGLINVIAPT